VYKKEMQVFMRHDQIRKRLSQGAIALLFLGLLLTSIVWSPKAHAATMSSVLSVNVNPYPTPYTIYQVGSTMSHVIATATDELGPGDPITATINWGDQTAPTRSNFIDGRTFQVSGSHAYSKVGTYTITVTVAITALQQSATGTGTINVVPNYTLKVNTIKPRLGQTFSGTIATGTDSFPNDPLNGTINWGDQTAPTSVQVVSSASGAYQINATHIYTTFNPTNSWTITVSLNSILLGPITATGTATLAPRYTLSANRITVHAGQPFQANVAKITGPISAGGLSVSIEWGDQTISKLTLGGGKSDRKIQGNHTYSQAGTYTFIVIVKDLGTGEQANASGTATVR
jgi:hypothetical protein